MKLRFSLVALLLVFVAVLVAGCGGGGTKSVPADAVAVVGHDTITKQQFNTLLAGAKRTYAARKTPFPKPGTTQYKSLQDQAMQYLVQQSELEQKAKDLGVTVTTKDVDQRLSQIKQQYFGGSQKKYEAQLKSQGLTEPQVKSDLHAQILSEKIYKKITSDVKVTNADVQKYYNQHKSDYTQAASRDVRHILVNSKKLADQLEQQLKNGADFAKLAKKYSKDPGSAANGGKLTVSKGQTVPEFDKAAFSLKTNEISKPVHTTYGWHIIQPLSAVKPAKQTPLSDVKASIKSQLENTKKQDAMNKWVADVKKEFSNEIRYQAGYQPTATTTTSTTTGATTTNK
ncbi:MAG TPA: peptidylprolyl isomerase [Gaiellaceae bacterium]|nr:peptidylprolyl isomerase [Gaiellaceae bacterium]